jgi:outer membrane protein assembly factor BamB
MMYARLGAAGDKLLVLEKDGTLHIVNASPAGFHECGEAEVLRSANAGRLFVTPPVLVDGLIYCRNYSGDLACVDARK